ncbi:MULTISPECIES: FAD/NAD(P)-binding protein [unclassified Rhizobium]|uniref:FAD/NAD(P)-binding protein n=1 Tax=unclassified Rhizobium TaxID=2613769 RepID=UPI001AD9CA5F|nr:MULTISPECIES: FAD/NAD(P)-binding protein [unclassified Rhizobium]MBO9096822.1 FAD/NAD(P)-binding protein [Rhizobium sp. L58/93]MBO9134305.1 FAD/NAD(P)-binding protein [Rhizobium sp. B209b/85]MBO9167077.1 FAD/NAD(P)-binding protein [Rhizobium sp. L245/93]MBO9183049.1 FAD/NAD(P)-binding protein [Rhizobium sp. E27B/91]QXZ83413.1 FAD/NAD(P)-binding protein [Rhizobium sp. K1/93]
MAYDVAVVGSGFSAIAVTINLLRLLPSSARIAVVGDDPGFGRGTAYRTEFYLHRLNVPAGRMSVFPDEPDDFVAWLRAENRLVDTHDFASRGDYGRYLRDRLAALLRDRPNRAGVDFIKAKARACVECATSGVIFHLDNQTEMTARNVVLCLGVGNAELPLGSGSLDAAAKPRIVRNPWRLGWLSKVAPSDEICILGSGLTMIDQVLALRAHGHRGPIHLLSRRGLLPHSHRAGHHSPAKPDLPTDTMAMSAVLHALRRQVRGGTDWRDVMDGLRSQTQSLWQRLDKDQRARFLRHALAWWNIHRHRIAPAVFSEFDGLVKDGTVTAHAGFLQAIRQSEVGLDIHYRPRGRQEEACLRADWVVNCTGMERAGVAHSPLLREMLEKGMIAADELGLGIVVDRHSRVLDAGGRQQDGLFAIGALTAGQFWEITAVPDIRMQALDVARSIAGVEG